MITAQEARKTVENSRVESVAHEQKVIEEEVMKAIQNNAFSCYLSFYISEATAKWLKELGYRVNRFYDQDNGHFTKITW